MMMMKKDMGKLLFGLFLIGQFMMSSVFAVESDAMWLRYAPIEDSSYLERCRTLITGVEVKGDSALVETARKELNRGLKGLLGKFPGGAKSLQVEVAHPLIPADDLKGLGREGFLIRTVKDQDGSTIRIITANADQGLLYGTHTFLRLLQLREPLDNLSIRESPKIDLRMHNHWDNVFRGSVERGYAGSSIFKWNHMGDERQEEYARFLSSVGINATVINNVNTSGDKGWQLIDEERLRQLRPLAKILARHGIRIFLSVNYNSPLKFDDLQTSDPLSPKVQVWWKKRADLIYQNIPNFGGILVKADSEGEPGPMAYGRTHSEGANMLAAAFAPHNGVVIWRAFVYHVKGAKLNSDRAAQAYEVFHPLEGEFADNVLLQIKNGPLDFQPREAISPLFGQMPKTRLSLELQVTQEYTGFSTHLCYLVPQWKYYLDTDTFAGNRPGTSLGKLMQKKGQCIAGVSNLGRDANWTGHALAQANAYGFARLAWNPELSAAQITDEWVRMTYGHDPEVVSTISAMLLSSYKVYEDYTIPMAATFFADMGHFRPGLPGRTRYHGSDSTGIGTDRSSATGSGYAGQYPPLLAQRYQHLKSTQEELLAFFHHVPYRHRLSSGKSVIQHIYDTHYDGVDAVRGLIKRWEGLKPKIDSVRHKSVASRLRMQLKEAVLWRDAVVTYYRDLSGIPDEVDRAK